MAFHFSLDGLLRLRKSLERAELQRLQTLAAAIARARAEIDSLEKLRNASRAGAASAVASAGLTGAELHFEIFQDTARLALRSRWLKELADLEQKRIEQQARYRKARMQREIVSNLYDRQRAEYDRQQLRRMQQQIDELFLIRSIPAAREAELASDEESK